MITEDSVRDEICAFRASLLDRLKADDHTFLGVLRYGAHLPHLWAGPSNKVTDDEPQVPVILSHMLDFLPKEDFEGESRFIVLDDTVYRGRQMRKHVARLESLGVARHRITTAAIVVHEKSEFKPDITSRTLDDREYIQWKECFTKLVRTQRRSTDRDHPLYFFEIQGLSSGQLLSIVQRIGDVASIDHHSYGDVYAFSVNMDSKSLLRDCDKESYLCGKDGIRLEDLCKIRFYWEELDGRLSLTLVPMAFSTIALDILLHKYPGAFAAITGIDLSLLDYLKRVDGNSFQPALDAWERFAYFLMSRGISAQVLEAFLTTFTKCLKGYDASLRIVDADQQDFPIRYVFPEPYIRFYTEAVKRIEKTLRGSELSPDQALLFEGSAKINLANAGGYVGSGLPRKYDLLKALYRNADPAVFNGREWIPNDACSRGVPFSAFVAEVGGNSLLASRSLDELLDSGLLRAGDSNVAQPGEGPTYSRTFLPGGEYNAVLVSRLALSCRAGIAPESDCEEEQFDSWGEA